MHRQILKANNIIYKKNYSNVNFKWLIFLLIKNIKHNTFLIFKLSY